MINKIGKITLYVENQDTAKAFWVEKLGFSISEKTMGPMKWIEVFPENEFTSFVLYDKNLMKQQNSNLCVEHPSVILSTNDIEKAHKEMKEKGIYVEDIMAMPYGKMFSFKDQDGNMFLLREDTY